MEPCLYDMGWLTAYDTVSAQTCLVTLTAVLRRATISPATLSKYGYAFKNTNHSRYNMSQSSHLLPEVFWLCFAQKIHVIAWIFQVMLCVLGSSLCLTSTLHSRENKAQRNWLWGPLQPGSQTLLLSSLHNSLSRAWRQLWTDTSSCSPFGLTRDVNSWIRSFVNTQRSCGQLQFPWPENCSVHCLWIFFIWAS